MQNIADDQIIALYFRRDQQAIAHTEKKYGGLCQSIAKCILGSREDAEECVNDAFLGAWNAIPPYRPAVLSAFLGKITRRLCRCGVPAVQCAGYRIQIAVFRDQLLRLNAHRHRSYLQTLEIWIHYNTDPAECQIRALPQKAENYFQKSVTHLSQILS